jgi:glycosyltransferase involved in cell wall biosynthesis
MSDRLKVLISAYACEPNKGSEPEVGWQLALHLAKHHDVTVITRANNQSTIEAGLVDYPGPRPNFIYYDLPNWVVALKKRGLSILLYYFFWQLGARLRVRLQLESFDLIHHATFNSFRHPGFWWFCGKPVVLGPLGGGQICPWRFLPWFRKQVINELMRSLSVVNSYLFPHIYLSFYFADKILVANEDTERCIPWLFHPKSQRMLETAVTPDQITDSVPRTWDEIRLLWISRLDKLKGGEITVRAFALALREFPNMTLTMVGTGREERPLKRLIEKLGLEKSVIMQGRVPKTQISEFLSRHDVFVFTSLRDTSGNVVLEAMAAGLPVITFRHHGVAEITTDETATRIPITTHRNTVAQLAQAMVTHAESSELRTQLGKAGRERVKEKYLWEKHAQQMSVAYREAVEERRTKSAMQRKTWRIIFVPKGILLALAVLFFVGALQFFSVSQLKRDAHLIVVDTLPGLSYAGSANFSLSQSFSRTLLMVLTVEPEQRALYQNEMLKFSEQTTKSLESYKLSIFSEKDRKIFEQLVARRGYYLEVRERILELLNNNQQEQAIALCQGSLLPAYNLYKESGENLLEYNMREGRQRGESIMRVSSKTQFLVASIGIGLFVVGFMFGLSK